ncbi:vWA domain-containing protein [Aporhodopirellula aestuarii]|uniref:VWA domain-containing protein n=1 Tax=Aporhodopirellula aestuarii TaxID=2950107 RepID=A0ABT0U951_9BACT|nr:vWA domain-containing protein [Aporhodopirellula aestuarii]MCM2373498.1 VWA domain-containing protein [Aporhodopirellula aestuarii]
MIRTTAASHSHRCLRFGRRANSRRGAMLILIAIMLFMFLITMAFSIDIAQMHLSRAELRAASDAAANAAATTLADTLDQNAAIARGQEIAAANFVNNDPLLLAAGDFDFGRSERQANGKYEFSNGGSPLNSVRVNGRRTVGSRSGAVPLLFGNVTGTELFEPSMTSTATYIERDITLVIDRSGSMSGQKFADLTSALIIFTNLLNSTPVEEQVGLASYNDRATEDVQLTENFGEITDALARLRTAGYTSISRGMQAGQNIASRGRPPEFVERTMIVMTDGQHNRGIEPRIVAADLADDDVTIHTITFGNGADIRRMREVAEIGGGRHYHALTGAELQAVYRDIALTLGTVLTD